MEEALMTVIYWVASIAISLVLAAITVLIFLSGFKFAKNSRKVLGAGCIVFSLVAACMVVLMIQRQFF